MLKSCVLTTLVGVGVFVGVSAGVPVCVGVVVLVGVTEGVGVLVGVTDGVGVGVGVTCGGGKTPSSTMITFCANDCAIWNVLSTNHIFFV